MQSWYMIYDNSPYTQRFRSKCLGMDVPQWIVGSYSFAIGSKICRVFLIVRDLFWCVDIGIKFDVYVCNVEQFNDYSIFFPTQETWYKFFLAICARMETKNIHDSMSSMQLEKICLITARVHILERTQIRLQSVHQPLNAMQLANK